MRNIQKAIDLIKKWEGFRSKAYLDPVGIPTIGYGTIQYPNGQKVKMGDVITEASAEHYLKEHIETDVIPPVDRLIKVDLNDNQYSAIVSFTYNLGSGNLSSSTLLKKLNNKDYIGAAKEFDRWVYAGGKKLKGLVNRRKEERALFEEPIEKIEPSNDEFKTEAKTFLEKLIVTILDFIDYIIYGNKKEKSTRELILEKNKDLNPKALDEALNWKDHESITNKDYIAVVDMTKYDYEKRFTLINMKDFTSMNTWSAHGSKSDPDKDGKPNHFSNVSGSNKSSLGAMVIGEEYVSSKRKSTSFRISRRIRGLEKGKNDNVLERGIVLHDADYVNPERAKAKNVGDSLGCFVLYYPVLQDINDKVEGILLYCYG